ncbi:hypothetical protein COOONC_15669 [Cooperia oncophora]
MDVSVVIPVKNGVPYIGECLDSLSDQTFKGTWEVRATKKFEMTTNRSFACSC